MAIKTISLSEEVYELLVKEKRPEESFSDTVKRIIGRTRPLRDFAGAWKEMPPEFLREIRSKLHRAREVTNKKSRTRVLGTGDKRGVS